MLFLPIILLLGSEDRLEEESRVDTVGDEAVFLANGESTSPKAVMGGTNGREETGIVVWVVAAELVVRFGVETEDEEGVG